METETVREIETETKREDAGRDRDRYKDTYST